MPPPCAVTSAAIPTHRPSRPVILSATCQRLTKHRILAFFVSSQTLLTPLSAQKREPLFRMTLGEIRRRPTLPGRFQPSTISVLRLNFCVRDGNRWIPQAIVTGNLRLSRSPSHPQNRTGSGSASVRPRLPLLPSDTSQIISSKIKPSTD